MKLELRKISLGLGFALLLLLGGRHGVLGLLIAVCIALFLGAVWSFFDGTNPPMPREHTPLKPRVPVPSAQIALRERAHLQHGDNRRLRSLLEGEPHLLELVGLGGRTVTKGEEL